MIPPATPIVPPGFEAYVEEWRMSPALAAGGFLFLTGLTGVRPDGACAADAAQQAEDAFDLLAEVLGAAGLDMGAVVEMTSYHVGLRDQLPAFRKIRAARLRAPSPAWTAIGVVELASAGARVEIRAVARRDASG